MMIDELIDAWFKCWQRGNYTNIPVGADFKHTSPFGIIEGKEEYLNLVRMNEEKFLGHDFAIHDILLSGNKACVRYTTSKGSDFSMEVSEWFYEKKGLISEIMSYYHIGEIKKDRKLKK